MLSRFASTLLLALLAAPVVSAQTAQIPFSFEYQVREQTSTLGLAGTVVFPLTPIGQVATATVRVSSRSTDAWRLARLAITGTGFQATAANVPIAAGAQISFPVQYTPTAAGTSRAVITLFLEGPGGQTVAPVFSLSGTAGEEPVALSYVANFSSNPVAVAAGESIRMAVSNSGGRQTATLVLSNRGTTALQVTEIRVNGHEAFELGGLPVLPFNIGPGGETRFFLIFAPTGRGPFTAQLGLTAGGVRRTWTLQGELASANLSFERLGADGNGTAVSPDVPLEFPAATVGAPRTTVRLRVRNTGTLASRIGTLSVTGAGFQLVDPPALPVTLNGGDTVLITVGFTPREPGPATGRLTIEETAFDLTANAVGGRFALTMSYRETAVDIYDATLALLPNTVIGGRQPFSVTVRNTGNQASSVTQIALSGPGFTLLKTPPLPARLEPGESLTVEAAFAPAALGVADGRLQVDQIAVPLRSVGNPPPAVPEIKFLNVTSRMQALEQPALALELAEAYPYDIAGRLTLAFAAENFLDDPSIQFVNGARTIDFRIPASTRRAVFPNGRQDIRFQTGSSAGAITLSAALTVSGVNATPSPAPAQEIAIAAAAPVIRALQIGTRTTNRVDLVITGASTARAVERIKLTLHPAPGLNLQTTTLTVNAAAEFRRWYQSAASRPLGSQFTATLRLDITGSIRAIDAVSVVLDNSLGDSSARKISLAEFE